MAGRKPRAHLWWPLLGLMATGCYEWVRVPPSELPRLDEDGPRALVSPNGAPASPVVRDERGKNVEVPGDFAIKVTTGADSVDFMSPVHCSVKEGRLQLSQDDDKPKSFSLAQIWPFAQQLRGEMNSGRRPGSRRPATTCS